MKQFLILAIFAAVFFAAHPNIKEMTPKLARLVDKSPAGEIAFKKQREQCERVWKKVTKDGDEKKLSPQDKKIYDNCDETIESYWDIIGSECSWYCGGGLDKRTATSSLKAGKNVDYNPQNAHDLSYKTAWIEGVPGYGIGESITYDFPPENPRITKIIVVNGYVKSEQTWKDNSRVKKLKMYIDNQPVAVLNLHDSRREQVFSFQPIGRADRQNRQLKSKPHWTIKFEIMEVYKGQKYEDTAITEIYFDGIDVH